MIPARAIRHVKILARTFTVLLLSTVPSPLPAQTATNAIPIELTKPNYRITQLEGIGHDPKLARQDPSNVIKVGELYYVWYTQRPAKGTDAYASTIYYSTSKDGRKWEDKGEALGKGGEDAWDSFGVITPYVAVAPGKYYLYYTGTSVFKETGNRIQMRPTIAASLGGLRNTTPT